MKDTIQLPEGSPIPEFGDEIDRGDGKKWYVLEVRIRWVQGRGRLLSAEVTDTPVIG